MKNILTLFVVSYAGIVLCTAQSTSSGTINKATTDAITRRKEIADSLKMERLLALEQFPFIKGGKWSGVIPVDSPTEIPDPKRDYKLLFEFTAKNPDSITTEINSGIDEVIHVLNLHVASGILPARLFPVILVRGPGMEALMNNSAYKKKHGVDNPNLKVINDLEKKAGARFIVCGQSMAFSEVKKEDLLPDVKISLTAKTVLSNYQLQGYVLYSIHPEK
ncbi:MAG: DsrE family protein [Bacteroidota bacterium]